MAQTTAEEISVGPVLSKEQRQLLSADVRELFHDAHSMQSKILGVRSIKEDKLTKFVSKGKFHAVKIQTYTERRYKCSVATDRKVHRIGIEERVPVVYKTILLKF